MKKALLVIFICLLSISKTNAQQESMTNQSIIEMIEIGLTEDIIITKIKTSSCTFDTSIDALKSLKEKGVNNNIIVVMMEVEKSTSDEINAANDAMSGIFFKKDDRMTRIHPTTFSGTKTNTLGSALTYGLASTNIKSTMSGATSNNVIDTTIPEFYFLFERNRNNISTLNWWFSIATSPNQFALVKLNVRGKKRELETGKVNIYAGTSMGVDEESIIKFQIEEINEYEFKVTPESPLKAGCEYCFFYQGVIPQGGYNNQSVFDFSVPKSCERVNKFPVGSMVYIQSDGKIRKCRITNVYVKDGAIYYSGETNSFKKFEWKESDCSSDKKDLEP